jgi:hypothetical protein
MPTIPVQDLMSIEVGDIELAAAVFRVALNEP